MSKISINCVQIISYTISTATTVTYVHVIVSYIFMQEDQLICIFTQKAALSLGDDVPSTTKESLRWHTDSNY